MLEVTAWDNTVFIIFILMGLIGGIFNFKDFSNLKYRNERWYILTKAAYGFYIALIYILIWAPNILNDPWIARQCIRGIVLVAAGMLILDTLVRKYRRSN